MSNIRVNTINDASGGSNAVLYGVAAPANSMGFRNRIINGDMRIDQRNAGAAVTVNNGNDFYAVDRWAASGEATDGVFTVQRSSTAPTGFTNSLLATVTTADASIGATQRYFVEQKIEGFNVADLGFGSASAQTFTLSFWVRSSVTGTFGGTLGNPSGSRYYPFSYTISAANTFEQKTVTVVGDTSGTWNTTTAVGLEVLFSLGCGSSRKGTAGAWTSSVFLAPTGSVDLIATSGATFYITGVQLEAGSVASPFERRDYGRELMMCQRYYQTVQAYVELVVSSGSDYAGTAYGAVEMRTTPTATGSNLGAFNFPASAGSLNVYGTRTVYDRRRASGTGAGNFATSITLSAEL
jgi:hypothetical protein